MYMFMSPYTLKDVIHLPMDSHSHLYEDVRDEGLYQEILASSLSPPPPLFDHRLPHQRNEWRSPTHPQVRIYIFLKTQPMMRASI